MGRLNFSLAFGLMFSIVASAAGPVAQSDRLLVDMIQRGNREATRRGVVLCNVSDVTVSTEEPLELERRTIKDKFGQDLPISVVREEDLGRLRNLYPAKLRNMDEEVCAQRAHTMGETLGRQGIEAPKLMLKPVNGWLSKGYIIPDNRVRTNSGRLPNWTHHVVNLIYVRTKEGSVEEYVIDPFMEGLPVPRAHWESRLRTNPRSSIGSEEVLPRYNYGPGDDSSPLSAYDQDELTRSYRVMSGDKS